MAVGEALDRRCTVRYKHASMHPAAHVENLKMSRQLRLILHEAAQGLGMTEKPLQHCEFFLLECPS